ncbi:CU044_2847 family protein [Streptomyces beihaiensis]|uniref:CU044_2847 family protein n=1 Tax=Streptomyces beihaiensis TaxID=2984495 RepID=A0ABT3TME9_9ACTN|nr:CU044_2847 family protein [Streptomyces beihaiensis]MCX3058222.1 CU044_2847 family protein [Streptomyces beihaiensis]
MAPLVRIPLDDGSTLTVETDGAGEPAGHEESPGIDRVGRGGDTLQTALARVQPALTAVVDHVRGLAHAPDSVTVEFGIKLSAQAGVIVAKAATEANFTITAQWSRGRRGDASGAEEDPPL